MELAPANASNRELVLTRTIDVPRERLFKTWITQLPLWWGPHGTTVPVCSMELKTGGTFRTVMRAPDGTDYATDGVFLELVENERIVFTDAYRAGWKPSEAVFFTAVVTFEPVAVVKTRYTARALHWTVQNCEKHERMGFHQGWGESLDRLVALVTAT